MVSLKRLLPCFTLGFLVSFASAVSASDKPVFDLIIENHAFAPATLSIPANTPFSIKIQNKDRTPEEFESAELKREKIIPGGASGTVNVGALKPGTYLFFGEFNQKTAQGTIVAQ